MGRLTQEQARELGVRAVACPGWLWLPGMLMLDPSGQVPANRLRSIRPSPPAFPWPGQAISPDLRDPATLGCLLFLVREVWAQPRLAVVWYSDSDNPGDWSWGGIEDGDRIKPRPGGCFDSEAEALVSALEAAPRSDP
jgi:hypothetical protein